jgi:cell division septation protein DedD
VQVAAVKERREADQLAGKLRAKGYPVRVVEDAGFLKVQVGPFTTKSDAQASEKRLKVQERLGTWVKPA